jgi:hypothetical protein
LSSTPSLVRVIVKAVITVILLSGLMETWIDAVAVFIVLAVLLALRDPALHRLGDYPRRVMAFPLLPRLVAGAVVSSVLAIIVSNSFSGSTFRPVIASVLISLIIFALVLPDHAMHGRSASPQGHDAAAVGATP